MANRARILCWSLSLSMTLGTGCGGPVEPPAGMDGGLGSPDALVPPDSAPHDDAELHDDDGGSADSGPPPECTADAHCSDGIACTVDRCVEESCRHTPDDTLCRSGATCDRVRDCVAATICATTADCADDDPCTQRERCDAATRTCQSTLLDGDRDGEAPLVCGGTDCNDDDYSIGMNVREHCTGEDDDCDGRVDEGTGAELCGTGGLVCRPGDFGNPYCGCANPAEYLCGDGAGGGACVNPTTDPRNCGGCGNDCGTEPCVAGECQCSGGLTACDFWGCVDTQRDEIHCGGCEQFCSSGQSCIGGTCTTCGAAGQPCCEGTCRATTLACAAGTCQTCGGLGQPCCAGGGCTAAGTTCNAGSCTVPDRGTCDDPIPRLTAAELPRCAEATRTCLLGCTTATCLDACFAADPTPPSAAGLTCRGCFNYANNWCADSGGCHTQWADYVCCADSRCPAGGSACVRSMCAAELTAFQSCSNALPDACFYIDIGEPGRCFP